MHFASPLALLALTSSTLASIYITNPVASTSEKGGSTWTIEWQADEDSATPLAKSYGSSQVALYTGSATQQLLLYRFETDIDPAKTTSLKVKVPASIGPDSSNYFIRIESNAATDSANVPLEAFSARFSLTGMTGKWTAKESSLAAEVAASTGSAATSSAAKSAKAKVVTSTKSASKTSTKSSTKSASASSAAKSSSASGLSTAVAKSSGVAANAASLSGVSSASGSATKAAKAAETTLPAAESGAQSLGFGLSSGVLQVAGLAVAAGWMVLFA